MAIKKATTKSDVLGGPPAVDPTPTIAPGDPAPETANLTDSGPDDAKVKTVTLTSPWGTKVTVAADQADAQLNAGFTK
jgi:hypothetical protein